MSFAYHDCENLRGNPVCGNKVTDMSYAYWGCEKLTGSPVCGNDVTDMSSAYLYCHNLTGSPVCGLNVTNMWRTYHSCYNLRGNAYFYSPYVENMSSCFENRNTSNCLNIYVKSNSVTNTTIHYTTSQSIVGNTVEWTNAGSYQFNSYYNIYIYPVENVAAANRPKTAMLYDDGSFVFQDGDDVAPGKTLVASYTDFEDSITPPWNGQQYNFTSVSFNTEVAPTNMAHWFINAKNMIANINNFSNLNMDNVIDMYYTYSNCYNLTGFPVCGDNVTNMSGAYENCYKLQGPFVCGDRVTDMSFAYYYCNNIRNYSPVCGNNVKDMTSAYQYCYNMIGPPACGDKVEDMAHAYYGCRSLNGSPVCGNNVIHMSGAYCICDNLTGSPVCGDKVEDMVYAYQHCRSLSGSPVCGNNVTDMYMAYDDCLNLTGAPVCGPNVIDMGYTYRNCYNLKGNAYFYSPSISNMTGCFNGRNTSNRLNIYVPANSVTNTTIHKTNYQTSIVGANIRWTNRRSYQYNSSYGIYIYPVANVAAARANNRD